MVTGAEALRLPPFPPEGWAQLRFGIHEGQKKIPTRDGVQKVGPAVETLEAVFCPGCSEIARAAFTGIQVAGLMPLPVAKDGSA
jgi:hypothetical protein